MNSFSADATASLPRVAGVIPVACLFIVVNEFCERFAYYGGSAPFQNYVQRNASAHLKDPLEPPGAFNLGAATATMWNNYFTFIAYASPLLGAYVADQYWGKFKTILAFSTIYMLGFFLLTYSAIPASYLEDTTPIYAASSYPIFIASITVIGLGTGGIKALVSPMCADQIPKQPYPITKTRYSMPLIWKKRYGFWYLGRTEHIESFLADPDLTVQSVYNWFYWAINVGAVLGSVLVTRLEQSSFWKAYLLPSCMFVAAILIFICGYKFYVHVPPEGSIYSKAFSCISYALQQKKLDSQTRSSQQGTVKESFAFLNYSKDVSEKDSKWYPSFPAELQQALKACSIFPLMTFYWVAYSQMTTNLIGQAGQMARPEWLTNDVVNNIDPIVLICLIPLFDAFIYPALTARGIQFGYIRRITLGIFIGGLSMVWAAVTQYMIYQDDAFKAGNVSKVSIYWQIISYALIAISEIFASIGSLEYSYTHAPESMKGIVSALSLFPNAAASAIGIFLAPFSTDPQVMYLYIGAAAGCFVTTGLFIALFGKYDKEDMAEKLQMELDEDTKYSLHNKISRIHMRAEIDELEHQDR